MTTPQSLHKHAYPVTHTPVGHVDVFQVGLGENVRQQHFVCFVAGWRQEIVVQDGVLGENGVDFIVPTILPQNLHLLQGGALLDGLLDLFEFGAKVEVVATKVSECGV